MGCLSIRCKSVTYILIGICIVGMLVVSPLLLGMACLLDRDEEDEKVSLAWVSRYDGEGLSWEYATAIAVDQSGNVYVTGYSGSEMTDWDYCTVKYNKDGQQLWQRKYGGVDGKDDCAHDIEVDSLGNVYVTGYSQCEDLYCDYATVKYDSNGVELWVARYNGPADDDDKAVAIGLDGEGNIYVTGTSRSNETFNDYATVKYNANGDQLWVARYDGPLSSLDEAQALEIDSIGYIYVTGSSRGQDSEWDYATVKYDAQGTQMWESRYNGLGNGDDQSSAMVLDVEGNAYVTGSSEGRGTLDDYVTIKYTSDGGEVWVARYSGSDRSDDWANDIAVDAWGDVYVAGMTNGNAWATIKYGPNGEEMWVALYEGHGCTECYVDAMALDSLGNIYVTGGTDGFGSSGMQRYGTVKYDADGSAEWLVKYPVAEEHVYGNTNNWARDIAIDYQGCVYVAGYSYGDGTGVDYTTIKYVQQDH